LLNEPPRPDGHRGGVFKLLISPPLPVLSLSKGWEGTKGRVKGLRLFSNHPLPNPPPSRGREV